ncbi:conserved hypothetical protein [Leishmania mexicana MHOM/GT/2001/U1103]|uniref:Uncharacterized protein n=1 Tax=Leishmania mexicana (strain MHOM/GT/2001/U1103) TaxID=929439 RepID=E9B637_LEIMU|nr:conserved hypothetical protein [Leishmania mexicana MHOM/GT/2001/U1103]CBZ30708.1 conserved hypothetical protein [Leishmania mexicana MHOM/GT/2001/U1103]
MRSKPRHPSRLALHPIGVASVIIIVVGCLAFGYHTGVRHTERGFPPRLVELRVLESELKVALRVCKSETQKLIDNERLNNDRVHEMVEAVAALEADQQTEENAYRAIEMKRENCTATHAGVRRHLEEPNENDTLVRLEVEELKRDIDALQVSIQKITHGEGMYIVMLNQGLQRLRSFYSNWCSRTPGCVELTDSELIERWGYATEDEAIMKEFVERDEEAQRTMTNNTFPGSSANTTDIAFQPTLAEEGDAWTVSDAPVFFNRSVYDKPLRGMDKAAMPLLPMRVTTALERFTDYGLCAYRHQNPNFTFQSDFKYLSDTTPPQEMQVSEKGKDVAYLHELVASPLLRFCIDCNSAVWTEHYKLACLRDRVQSHYGTHDFWAARSLIQASPSVRDAAFRYYEARGWHKEKILAVVLHQTVNYDRLQCDNVVDRKYGLHYQYLKANYPNITGLRQHISDDRRVQCSPSLEMMIEYIQKVRDQASYIFDHVYLSMAEDQRSTLESLLAVNDVTQLRPLLLPAYTNAEAEAATPGFTELVDLEIAGRATDILVSPFLPSSRYVTECFLLRNKLTPGDHVWTF